MDRDRPLTRDEVTVVVARLDGAKRDREGIAMYVMLEDRSGQGSAGEALTLAGGGPSLVTPFEHYREMLIADPESANEFDVARLFEILAAAHFTVED
jgi:hypothetical protein